MKKNITINLYGSLYAIDDDAYNLLEKYLNETKRYFQNRDGGDEIADDIEHRVAELLSEIKANGQEIITLNDIESIIRRIGNPEDMEEDGQDSATGDAGYQQKQESHSSDVPPEPPHSRTDEDPKGVKHRKLYRNPDDKMLGGVLSGFCCYFGGTDPLPWRLIFVLISLASLQVASIIYLLLWAFIPMAQTPEDRLRMKGKEVNMQNINEEIMEGAQPKHSFDYKTREKSRTRNLLDILLFLLVLGIKMLALLITLPALIGTLVCGALWTWAALGGVETLTRWDIIDAEWMGMLSLQPSLMWQTGLALFFATVFWTAILYVVIRALFDSHKANGMPRRLRTTLAWTTILSAILAIVFTISANITCEKAEDLYDIKSNTVNGIYMKSSHREKLNRNGWEILTYENCNHKGKLYYNIRSLTDKDRDVQAMSFRQDDTGKPMRVHLQHSEYLPAGYYRMEAIASAEGPGAYAYVKNGTNEMQVAAIPADDTNDYGNMKAIFPENGEDSADVYDTLQNATLSRLIPQIARYWSYVQTEPFYHAGGLIHTGTTNLGHIVHQPELNIPCSKYTVYSISIVPDQTAQQDKIQKEKNKKKQKKHQSQ